MADCPRCGNPLPGNKTGDSLHIQTCTDPPNPEKNKRSWIPPKTKRR